MLILTVLLPTTLRGFVKLLHQAICNLAEVLRKLNGQVHSFNRCMRLNIEPGSRAGMLVDMVVLTSIGLT